MCTYSIGQNTFYSGIKIHRTQLERKQCLLLTPLAENTQLKALSEVSTQATFNH